jgi:hypothetical protein
VLAEPDVELEHEPQGASRPASLVRQAAPEGGSRRAGRAGKRGGRAVY